LADVRAIAGSPTRLPPDIAWRLYEAGESGMGYTVFTLVFADGWRQSYVCGNAVDWVIMPAGRTIADIRDVMPHKGNRTSLSAGGTIRGVCTERDRGRVSAFFTVLEPALTTWRPADA